MMANTSLRFGCLPHEGADVGGDSANKSWQQIRHLSQVKRFILKSSTFQCSEEKVPSS